MTKEKDIHTRSNETIARVYDDLPYKPSQEKLRWLAKQFPERVIYTKKKEK